MYSDDTTAWEQQHFGMFYDIVNDQSYAITQEWVTDLNTGDVHLLFWIGDHAYLAHSICAITGKKLPVSHGDL